jgi:predicted TIM-barrel fold metal-dependent hydrolase
MIIDAHLHLWKKQNGIVNEQPVYDVGGGKSKFGEEIVQMLPPYITDGFNSAERLLANMDYGRVNACVVTQEYIDGNQDDYLLEVRRRYPDRFRICSLYEEREDYGWDGFDGIKICAGRLGKMSLSEVLPVFQRAEKDNKFISIDLAEGSRQVKEMQEIINRCPDVRIAIGHFGMVTRDGWEEQIALAKNRNVYIESGGITWLFHKEYYPYEGAVRAIIQAADICGMDKIMWGSDYPRTMTAITYPMSYDFILKSDQLTDALKDKFLWRNAAQFYRFSDLHELPYIKNMVED